MYQAQILSGGGPAPKKFKFLNFTFLNYQKYDLAPFPGKLNNYPRRNQHPPLA